MMSYEPTNIGRVIHDHIWHLPWYYFMVCLLAILYVRLRITFGETAYRMSKSTISVFVGILGLLVILSPVLTVLSAIEDLQVVPPGHWAGILFGIALLSYFILFLFGSVFAVYHFVNNLKLIGLAKATSPRTPSSPGKDVSLDRHQQRFSDLAARYLLLFGIAIFSDLFVVFVLASISPVFLSLDFTINLLCVYLQFAFAGQQYRRYCGCLDRACRKSMTRSARRRLSAHYEQRSIGMQSVATNSSHATYTSTSQSTAVSV